MNKYKELGVLIDNYNDICNNADLNMFKALILIYYFVIA
jgi:hypothetical protein